MENDSESEEETGISKTIFNSFLIHFQKKVKTAVIFTMRLLKKKCKALEERKVGKSYSEDEKKARIKYFEDQVAALKSFTTEDIGKFVTLVQKPLDAVLNDPKASIEQKALTRIAYHKLLIKDIENFREKYPGWKESIPNIIKSFGIKYRKVRTKRLKKRGKNYEVFESERKLLILLNEVVGLGIDAKLLKGTVKMEKKKLEKKKAKNDIPAKRGNKKVEEKQEEGEEIKSRFKKKELDALLQLPLKNEELESPLQIALKNQELEAPVQITSIFEDLEDSDDGEEEEGKEVLKERQLYTQENKAQNIKKNKEIPKNINKNFNNNNKRKNSTVIKEPIANPSKRPKTCKIPLLSNRETEELAGDFESSVTRARDYEIIKKQNKGTSKVILLNLNEARKKIDEGEKEEEEEIKLVKDEERNEDSSESEDEDFLKTGAIYEKNSRRPGFFVGRSSAGESAENEGEERSGNNLIFKRKIESDLDTSDYDSSKFKRKTFRSDDTNSSRGRNFGERNNLRGGIHSENGCNQGFMGRGRGRGQFGNQERWNNSSKDMDLERFRGRGKGRQNREGFVSKESYPELRNKSSDAKESANFEPLGKKLNEPPKKESGSSMLHPSWAAKKSQMEQMSICKFQGKKIVFDD